MSLPFLTKKPIDLPPIVSIELIQITDKTNIPFAPKAKKIIEEVKKDETYEKIGAMTPGNVYTTRGIVLLCGDLMEYTRNERVNKRRSIVIADADESCIEITVFGNSMMLDVGTYVKISMLKVNTWQEKTTGTVSNANAISCIHVPDENTRWFVDIYDDHRHRYEELVQPWTRSNVCKSERSL